MAGKKRGGEGAIIVVKKIEEGGHGHHGGAWKVAYADFVTAMMAFFLLMWLLNATSEEQRRGIADFFSPTNVLGQTVTGSGLPFAGRTMNSDGSMVSDAGTVRVEQGKVPLTSDSEEAEEEAATEGVAPNRGEGKGDIEGPGQPAAMAEVAAEEADAAGPGGERETPSRGGAAGEASAAGAMRQAQRLKDAALQAELLADPVMRAEVLSDAALRAEMLNDPVLQAEALSDAALRAEHERREREALETAAETLAASVREDPALAQLSKQLLVEVVPEGLRIQLLDAERQPMFPSGSALPNERARALLLKVAQVTADLPNPLTISGHTDATPFRGGAERSNWELSADRANAVRRLLLEAGVPEARIKGVAGHAARDPLLPDEPTSPANRRVAITLLRTAEPGAQQAAVAGGAGR